MRVGPVGLGVLHEGHHTDCGTLVANDLDGRVGLGVAGGPSALERAGRPTFALISKRRKKICFIFKEPT